MTARQKRPPQKGKPVELPPFHSKEGKELRDKQERLARCWCGAEDGEHEADATSELPDMYGAKAE